MTDTPSARTAEPKAKDVKVPVPVFILITRAKTWAAYQDEDSLHDQQTDPMLAAEAARAKERLLAAIEAL